MKSAFIVASSSDLAARNMYSLILKEFGEEFMIGGCKVSLVKVEGEVLHAKKPEDIGAKNANFIIILSRHSGTPGGPIITTHVSGNFGPAIYGGEEREIGVSMPFFMKNFLMMVKRRADEIGYPVALEPTHHGPSLDVPLAFVEVGSNERNWKDLRACKAVAVSAVEAITSEAKFIPAIAIGGPHLNDKFTKIELNSKYAIGHFVRKLDTEYLDLEMLEKALNRSCPKAEVAILDWKGIKGEKKREIVEMLEKLEVPVIKARKALKGG